MDGLMDYVIITFANLLLLEHDCISYRLSKLCARFNLSTVNASHVYANKNFISEVLTVAKNY